MHLPYVFPYKGQARLLSIGQFGGLNKGTAPRPEEFSRMKNMSSRFFPAIGTREERGEEMEELKEPQGLFHKNGLFYIDDGKAFYEGEEVFTVTPGKKEICGMAAYILVFPDKLAFNTADKTVKSMAVNVPQTGTVRFDPVDEGSVFTKITMTGIGNNFNKYDGVEITGCSNEAYNTTKILQEVGTDYIIVTGVLTEGFTQASGLTFKRNVPDLDFVCEANNRVWGCSSENHEIYGSKLGDPFNWNSFESISTDSYAATVGSDGDFTGCVSHMGYVLFFKEHCIHKLFGNRPSNFQMNSYNVAGVREGCADSLQVVNETLFYVGRDGVYSYDGSMPYMVSEKFDTMRLSEAVSGQQDGKYYVSANDGSGVKTYVYTPASRLWHVEDELRMQYAAYGDGKLFLVDGEGKIRTISGASGEKVEWFLESGEITENSLNNKYITKLLFKLKLTRGSVADISIICDDDVFWEKKATITAEWDNTYSVPIIPKRCSKYQYKISGHGQMKLLGVGRYVEEGSEVRYGLNKS